ncbi:protein-tyrosine phosphatase-like protein [Jimgerdemannia flammicorona]|uniref:Protein-tyrosine phosphatase-like protein n=2 Tax=Jimgerdemannia flammicorona TaxID=994334 RepID=A0A433DAY6_9FUNG|nr:protein-tyrosine phosphatase-like protein [Jimgerdemannia flammicorona]RUS26501.1 protein-tyrosine phosphatase-like protein [Jimgerdemannia flammicorona]
MSLPVPRFLAAIYAKPHPDLQVQLLDKFRSLSQLESQRLRRAKDPKDFYSLSVALDPLVQNRNRYFDVIPFDRNRVQLRATAPTSTYTNASHIDTSYIDGMPQRKYIASQGPLGTPHAIVSTVGDFWLMAWEQMSRVIVCLSKVEEGGKIKCARYWPEGEGEEVREWETSGGGVRMRVKLVGMPTKNTDAECEVRKLWVEPVDTALGAGRQVTQLAFFGWPDHGVPENAEHVLNLISLTRKVEAEYAREAGVAFGPTIVHCSAGCGRTGTFCAIDLVWNFLEERQAQASGEETVMDDDDEEQDLYNEDQDLIFEVVDGLRKQRMVMVQAPPQYVFCYQALWVLKC